VCKSSDARSRYRCGGHAQEQPRAAILAGGRRAARCAGWREKQIESLVAGANVGDHKPLLTVVMRRFDADLNKSD
jgi:hypothetical protein